VTDAGAGVDPFSIVIGYRRALVGVTVYDPVDGLALFALPSAAPVLKAGKSVAVVEASDFQETKNVNTIGADIMPNTAFKQARLRVVRGPALTWLRPRARGCAARSERLLVVASSSAPVRSVRFTDGARQIGVDRAGPGGLFGVGWSTAKARKGAHVLRAVARDAKGRTFGVARVVRVCR
jgi:hypothetical protein